MVLNNAKNIVKQVLSSGDTKGLLEAKDVGGNTRYIADFSAYPAVVEDTFTLTAANAGISVGSASTAPTATDYQLGSTITSGLSGSVTTAQNVDNDGNTSITFTLTLTNTSGSSISISEIGYKQEIAASDSASGTTATDRVFLLDRTVFDTITLAASEQAIIDYTIKSVVTNSGGALGTKTISANGTYDALDDLLDGYSEVTVSVSPNVGTKSITQNGTYNASSDSYDGYSQVTVNVSGGGAGGGIDVDVIYNRTSYPSSSIGNNQRRTYTFGQELSPAGGSFDDYDAIYVMAWGYWNYSNSEYEGACGMLVFKDDYYKAPTTDPSEPWSFALDNSNANQSRLLWFRLTNSTTLNSGAESTEPNNEPIIFRIYGLKFGVLHTYSTTPQVIGTWVNGDDLYEVCVATGGSAPTGATVIDRISKTGYDVIQYTL